MYLCIIFYTRKKTIIHRVKDDRNISSKQQNPEQEKSNTGSPHIVRFHFVRFTLCATFGKSTLLSIKPHFVLEKIAQSEIYTNVHFVRNFTLCEFS